MTAALREPTERTSGGPGAPGLPVLKRWLPFAAGLVAVAGILLAADTPPLDLARYAVYVIFALALPGTLVYRVLRRTPHTLVEDVALGITVGLVLELAAWAAFSAFDLEGWLWLWPVAVIAPFVAVARLRRHWRVRDYAPTPAGWSWSVSGVVAFFTGYLSLVFLERNPVLPTSEGTLQYLDLAYQLSLAGEAKHHIPPDLPQVAGEPLYYHWFGYVHMAATSLIGQIDLPVVALRLAIPGLCALAAVLTAVVGWRVSGRPYVGALAAALFWVIGEVDFIHPTNQIFGTQATFVVWHGMSMTYSWVLLIALIAPLAEIVGRTAGTRVPVLGWGAFVLATLLLLASAGAKASTLPVVIAALLFSAVLVPIGSRRVPWRIVGALGIAAAVLLLASAVLFRFHTYGVGIGLFSGLGGYWEPVPGRSDGAQMLVVLGVFAAFYINMELRASGILPLLWLRRGRLDPTQIFLLGGAIGGPAIYLVFSQMSGGNQYFTRAGFAFAVMLSAWGFALVFDRARPTPPMRLALAVFAVVLSVVLIGIQLRWAGSVDQSAFSTPFDRLEPVLLWSIGFAVVVAFAALAWDTAGRWLPGLRGRGAVTLLTAVLVFGAPGLIMDSYKSVQSPNGGAYYNINLPRSRVEAARWVRDHSRPDDVIATNRHCLNTAADSCDARVFWLSAYAERSVLVEGWSFAPRTMIPGATGSFWNPELLALNDAAFAAPSEGVLSELRHRHRVRYLVVDRDVAVESPLLEQLADLRFDNGRLGVYELR